ncbi:MAG: AraC family transcriptional regulator [Clostridia bacterium]|nr:AraC family transcriptional regulator [Clostridia bacterium]
MDWISGIQRALNYIEEHLADELEVSEIAAQAACSGYYFQRIFGILCGITLGEYIRFRRLTLAGSELADGARVIDVALKYGYDSPESFSRAFQRFHGIPPSDARKREARLRTFSRLTVQITLKGGNLMDYKIVEREEFCVLEKVEPQSIHDGTNMNTIPAFWDCCKADGTIRTLLAGREGARLYGTCYGDTLGSAKTFDYGIGTECAADTIPPEGFRVKTIPARTWAVFSCTGAMPLAIQRLWHQICSEFFTTSDWQPTYEFDIEVYPAGDMLSPDYHSEIWVAVKRS